MPACAADDSVACAASPLSIHLNEQEATFDIPLTPDNGKQKTDLKEIPIQPTENPEPENFSVKLLNFCFQFCCWPCLVYLGR